MPRSRRRVPRPAPLQGPESDHDPELAEWGHDPDELEDDEDEGDELGEPPPIPAAPVEPAVAPSAELVALGPPPKDTLEAEKWAHSVLMRQAFEVMMSDKINETTRRKEVRTILRDAKGHVTDAARYDYMKLVESDRQELENHKRGRAVAVPVAVGAPPGGARIIPLIQPE